MAIKRSLAWMAISQIASFGLQFAASIVVAHVLTPYELGVYAVAAAAVGALAVIQALGLGNLIVRDVELPAELVANIFTINAIMALVLSLAIAGAAALSNWFFDDPHVRGVLLILAAAPLVSIFDIIPAARFERDSDFKTLSIANGIRSGTTAIMTIGLALAGFKFLGLALAQVLGVAFTAIYLCFVGRRYLSFSLRLSRWREVLSYGVQLLTLSGLTSIFQKGSDLILGRFLGLPALGVYNRAGSLNSLILDKVRITVERIIFSHMAARVRADDSLRSTYLYTVEMMSAVLWPAFGGLAVLAEPIIRTIYGDRWVAAAPALTLLAVASIVQVSISLTWELFLLRGNLATQSRIEFIRTVIGFVAFAIACKFSLVAAAGARILDALVANVLYRREVERMTDTSFGDFAGIYGRSLGLTVLAIVPGLIALNREGPVFSVPLLSASIVGGVALWGVGLVILKHPLLKEIIQPFNRLRARVQQAG